MEVPVFSRSKAFAGCQQVWLNRTDSFFYKNGVFAVFISRLTPFFPFKVISYGAGLTTMKLSRFLFATGIGQTPAIVLYSYAGRNLTRNVSFIVLITMVCVALGIVIYYYRVKIEQYFQKWLSQLITHLGDF